MQITGDKLDQLGLKIDNYRMTDDLIEYMWKDEKNHYSEEIETTEDWSRPHIFKTMFVVKFQNELNDILKYLDSEDDHILLKADTGEYLSVSGNYEFDDEKELGIVLSENLGEYVAFKVKELIWLMKRK
mgnify:FL=1